MASESSLPEKWFTQPVAALLAAISLRVATLAPKVDHPVESSSGEAFARGLGANGEGHVACCAYCECRLSPEQTQLCEECEDIVF